MNTTMRLQALACAMAALASGAALAETKTDGQWRGTGGAALAMTSGNSETTALSLAGDMSMATTSDKTTLGASANYGRAKINGTQTTTSDKWAAFGQYDYNLGAKTFVFGKLGFEGDKIAKLSLRTALAAGVGYKLIDTKETSFTLLGGAGYTTDKYSEAQTIGSKTDTRFSRASLFLGEESSHQISATTTFKQRLELYPGMSGDKAHLAKFSAGLAVAISSTLNLTVALTDSYNSKPPAGLKKNDMGLFTGINVKFGAQ